MPFAKKLSSIRKQRGFTQQELAEKAGVGIAQMRRYEAGKSSPTLEVIKNLALTLNISADELVFEENEGVMPAKKLNQKLLEQLEMISKMDPIDRQAIETVIESIILKNKLEDIMPSRKDDKWSEEMGEVVNEFRKGAEQYSDEEIERIVDEAVNAVKAKNA
jgi:transcriptional regulator with XRE-family HTH domain